MSDPEASPESPHPIPGIYEHFKSTSEEPRKYQVLYVAKNPDSGEIVMVYQPLYTTSELPDLPILWRSLENFAQEVELEGQTVPRFRYVGPTDTISS